MSRIKIVLNGEYYTQAYSDWQAVSDSADLKVFGWFTILYLVSLFGGGIIFYLTAVKAPIYYQYAMWISGFILIGWYLVDKALFNRKHFLKGDALTLSLSERGLEIEQELSIRNFSWAEVNIRESVEGIFIGVPIEDRAMRYLYLNNNSISPEQRLLIQN